MKFFRLVAIGLLLTGSLAYGTDLSNSITGSITDSVGTMPYRLFEPEGIASDQKVPLILYLHGMGERGTDNTLQTVNMSGLQTATKSGQYASYVLAPQIDTTQWFASNSGPSTAMIQTMDALQKVIASTPQIDLSRIYVTGISMGAMGVWDIMKREPTLFAAAVTIAGAGDVTSASIIKNIPVWDFHGSDDPLVPVQASRDMIAALRAAGGNPLYTEIAGAGHEIWNNIYSDSANLLYPWLFSQHQGAAISVPPTIDATAATDTTGATTALMTAMVMQPAAIPEPAWLSVGLLGMVFVGRRKRA